LEAALETAVLFVSLALVVTLAVYSWLGALGAWSSGKDTNRSERLVYFFIAGVFTMVATGARYSVAFVVRPFG
jgi:hypothetical protein